jgi:hypothetical protein
MELRNFSVAASANEPEELVRGRINQVDRVVPTVSQVVLLCGVVVPTDIEGAEIGRRVLDQSWFSK